MEPLIKKLGITKEEIRRLSIDLKCVENSGHPDSHREYRDKHSDYSDSRHSEHSYSEHADRYGNHYSAHSDYAPGVN